MVPAQELGRIKVLQLGDRGHAAIKSSRSRLPQPTAGHRITPESAGWRYVGIETRTLKTRRAVETRHRRPGILHRHPVRKSAGDGGRLQFGHDRRTRDVFGPSLVGLCTPAQRGFVEAEEDCEIAICSAPATGPQRASFRRAMSKR